MSGDIFIGFVFTKFYSPEGEFRTQNTEMQHVQKGGEIPQIC